MEGGLGRFTDIGVKEMGVTEMDGIEIGVKEIGVKEIGVIEIGVIELGAAPPDPNSVQLKSSQQPRLYEFSVSIAHFWGNFEL